MRSLLPVCLAGRSRISRNGVCMFSSWREGAEAAADAGSRPRTRQPPQQQTASTFRARRSDGPLDDVDRRIEERKVELYAEARKPARVRNLARVNGMIADMLKECPPRMHLYNVLLHARIIINDVGGLEEILALIKQHNFQFNDVTYNLLITYYRNNQAPEECEKLLEQMIAAGLQPSRYTYTTLITAFKAIDVEKACKYFDLMKGSQKHYEKPDLFAYNAMIGSYMHFEDYVAADALVQEMGQLGIEPNCVTYEVLIEGLSKGRRYKDAWAMYETLMTSKARPSRSQVEDICRIFFKNHNGISAFKVLKYLEDNYDVVDPRCINSAAYSAIYAGSLDAIEGLFERHIRPNLAAYAGYLQPIKDYAIRRAALPQIVEVIDDALTRADR